VVLSVKSTMVICLGCIAGITWVLSAVEQRREAVPAPLVAAAVPIEVVLGAPTDDPAALPRDTEWRSELVQQFAARSPADTSAAPGSHLADELPVAERTVVLASATEPPALPARPRPAPEDPALAALEQPTHERNAAYEAPAATRVAAAQVTRPAATMTTYTVRKGDSLSRIAQRTYGTCHPRVLTLLTDVNDQVRRRNGNIWVGEEILLPDRDSVLAYRAADDGKARRALREAVVAAAQTDRAGTAGYEWYTIRRNDTLVSIARRRLDDPERWREILELNQSLKPHKIFPGERIRLPVTRLVES
jgi:nucleoid-associated protein YgaU